VPARRELLIALAAAAALQAELWLRAPSAGSAVAALSVLVLALARVRPLLPATAIAVALAVDAAADGVLVARLATPLAVLAAACLLLGLHAPTRLAAAAGAAVAVAAMTTANQLAPGVAYPPLDDLVFFALLLGTPAIVGVLLRERGAVVAELAARAEALQVAREKQAAAAAAEERARVTIGVHDALAHRLGEITLQVAGTQRVAARAPGPAQRALARIEDAARAALDDIRETIGVLRRDEPELGLVPHHAPGGAVPAPWPAAAAPPPAARPATPADPAAGRAADSLLAAGTFAAIAIETLTSSKLEGSVAANLAVIALVTAPLAFRRRAPLAAALATVAALAVQKALVTPPSVLVTPLLLLLVPAYTVAAQLPLRRALAGLAICVAGTLAVEPSPESALIGLLAWVAGRAVRDRAIRAQELREVTSALERAGDAGAARARAEERLRIARELHDAVAHSMTVIVLQAGAAQRVWDSRPEAARAAVDAIAEVARDTLGALRERLREEAPTRLAELDELVARVRPLGLDVTVGREAVALPAALDHVAFCVVQEALTNAVRHAAPTAVRVSIARDPAGLLVEVADCGRSVDGPAQAVTGTGTGLRGMAERVAACGGELVHGPAGAGYRVVARLPLTETPA
jgi:signal transduction histidine kinase